MQPNDPNQFADPNQTPSPPRPQPLPPQQPIAPASSNPLDQTQQYPANQPAPIMPDMNTQNVTPSPEPLPAKPSAPFPQPPTMPTPTPIAQAPMPDATANTFDTPPSPVPMPNPPPQPQQPEAPLPQAPKKSFPIKKLLVVLGALLVVGLIAILAIFLIGKFGSGAPKYSETKTVELAGFSTDENSGMSFEIPKEMEETLKTDLSANYVHKEKSKDDNEGELGNVNAAIETISYTADLTEDQKKEVIKIFNSEAFDKDANENIGPDVRNVKISNKTVTENNSLLRADIYLEVPSIENSEEFMPAKGAIILRMQGKRVYSFLYFFAEDVFSANEGFVKKMEESIKFGT